MTIRLLDNIDKTVSMQQRNALSQTTYNPMCTDKPQSDLPLVSIITVVFNSPAELEATINSVLSQNYPNYQYIIIDGGSTDGKTIEVIKKYENQIDFWLSETDSGIYDAMNKGIHHAKPESYLNFLNAGDTYCTNDVLVRLFKNSKTSTHIVYGDIIVVNEEKEQNLSAMDFNKENLLKVGTAVLCHQAMFIKKEIVPYYNTTYRIKGELDWYFEIVDKNKNLNYLHVAIPVVYYHLGGYGHKHFLRNRAEWVLCIIRRYGFKTLYEYNIIGFLYKNSFYRYPRLGRMHYKTTSFFNNLNKFFFHLVQPKGKMTMFFSKKKTAKNIPQYQMARNPTCFARLENAKKNGFNPKVIFDCGASVGNWSKVVSKMFPEVQLMLIEPNTLVIDKTKEAMIGINPKPIIIQGAIGKVSGKTHLNIWDNEETKMSGSSLKGHVQGDPMKRMEVELFALDELSSNHALQPDLIKLDLQGGEKEALLGSTNLLKTTEMFIIEFSCLEAYIDRTTPLDVMQIMFANDYCLYDIVDLIYRPYDDALTGGDLFFVKNSSPLRKYKGYK